MSADAEAATADRSAVEAKVDAVKTPEDGPSEAADNDGEEKERKPHSGTGRELDDKYSKNRRTFYKDRKNGNYRGKPNRFDRNNVKSRYDDQEKSSDPFQIRKQVEFYFSDGNLHQDKFLFEQIGGSDNRAVDIKVIAGFKRMHRFEPYSAIVDALKESATLEVLNGDKPNDEQIKRKTPLPENFGKSHAEVKANYDSESMKRSIYAKGFGSETAKTQLEIEEFFAPYQASTVRLRRSNDGTFKGSVFVEFPSEEDMQQFLDLETKPEWEGKALDIKSKEEYCKEKDKLINEGKVRRNDLDEGDTFTHGGRRGKGGDRGRDGGGRRFRDNRNKDRSRSRSRSRGRGEAFRKDLKRKSWRELADKEDQEREAKKQKDKHEQDYDDAGIPKIKSTPKDADVAKNGHKRAREEGDEEEGAEVKKARNADSDDE